MTFDEVCEVVARERAAGSWPSRLRWLNLHRLWLTGWARYLTTYRLPWAKPDQRDWRPCERAWLIGDWPR